MTTALKDKSRGPRLQKVLAESGLASRRDCEAIIQQGRVTVNGQRVSDLPAWVDPGNDLIEVDGQRIVTPAVYRRPPKADDGRASKGADPAKLGLVYVMLNKPKRVITTTDDPQGRTSVMDLIDLPKTARHGRMLRLFPVGRLDADSTGLVLLTNDGPLAHTLTHPSFEIEKQYKVSVRGKITPENVEALRKGLYLAHRGRGGKPGERRGPKVKKASVEGLELIRYTQDRARGDQSLLKVVLSEGQNREIRRLFARLGHKVRRLHRVSIGPLRLKGVALGDWRMLTSSEVQKLRKVAQKAATN